MIGSRISGRGWRIHRELAGQAPESLLKNRLSKSGRFPDASDRGFQVCWQPQNVSAWRWIVFLDKGEAIESAIAYVVQNPIEEGRKPQVWPFVVPFRGVESNIVSYRD